MLEGTLKIIQFQTHCQEQECLPLDQITQSPTQPGFEHFSDVTPPAALSNLETFKEVFILLPIISCQVSLRFSRNAHSLSHLLSPHGLYPVSHEQVAHAATIGLSGRRWGSDARNGLDETEMNWHRACWSRISFTTPSEDQ